MTLAAVDLLGTDAAAVAVFARAQDVRAANQRWTTEELLLWWRSRNYRDPATAVALDWGDDVERVAITAHFLTWNTPEAVGSMIAAPSSQAAMGDLWRGMRDTQRQLLRRRAVLMLSVAARITL